MASAGAWAEADEVLAFEVFDDVAGQVVVVVGGLRGDVADVLAEHWQGCLVGALLAEQVETDGPARLAAAMLAGNFVQAAVEGPAQAEVVGVQGENLVGLDGAPEPFRERDLAVHEATLGVVLALQGGGVEQAEEIGMDVVAGGDVGLDCAAAEAPYCAVEGVVVAAAEVAVGEAEDVGAVDYDAAGDGLSAVLAVHDVGDGVDEDVLVADRGHAEGGGRDGDAVAVFVLVVADLGVAFVGEDEEGMLEMLRCVLEADAGDVDGEEVGLRVANGEERVLGGHMTVS